MSDRLRTSLGTLVAQLFFIAAGVYLGNQADDWKQEREHRQAARATLENFRTEFVANRDRVRRTMPFYEAYIDSMRVSQERGDPPPRSVREVFRRLGWRGLRPVNFSHTAWDLALATQSLSYLPSPLAFQIARVYAGQEYVGELQDRAGSVLFNPAAMDDARTLPWVMSFGAYAEDMRLARPQMAGLYDTMVPRIDSALAKLPK